MWLKETLVKGLELYEPTSLLNLIKALGGFMCEFNKKLELGQTHNLPVTQGAKAKTVYDLFTSKDAEHLNKIITEVWSTGQAFSGTLELSFKLEPGQNSLRTRSYDLQAYLANDAQKLILLALNPYELKQDESTYLSILNEMSELICRYDKDLKLSFVNKAYADFYGKKPEELLGKSWYDAVEFDEKPKVFDYFKTLSPEKPSKQFSYWTLRPDGKQRRWLSWEDIALFDAEGQFIEYQGVGSDLTEIFEKELALEQEKKHNAFLANLINNASETIISTDDNFKILSWNKAAEDLYEYTQEEVLGKNITEVVPTSYESITRDEVIAQFRERGQWQGESIQYSKTGEKIEVWASVKQIFNEQGQAAGVVTVNRDIRIRKTQERQLLESRDTLRALLGRFDKLQQDERNQLARSLHDNLGLNFTALNHQLAGLELELSNEQKPYLQEAYKTLQVLSTSLRGLLEDLRITDLLNAEIVPSIEALCKRFHKNYGLICDLDLNFNKPVSNQIVTVIYQVLNELLNNVIKHAHTRQVNLWLAAHEQELELIVQDNGVGIVPEKISNPLSLGLIGMRERLAQVGGSLSIETPAKGGTLCRISVPLS